MELDRSLPAKTPPGEWLGASARSSARIERQASGLALKATSTLLMLDMTSRTMSFVKLPAESGER